MRSVVLVDGDARHRAVAACALRLRGLPVREVGCIGDFDPLDLAGRDCILLIDLSQVDEQFLESLAAQRTHSDYSKLSIIGMVPEKYTRWLRNESVFDFVLTKPLDINIIFAHHCHTVTWSAANY